LSNNDWSFSPFGLFPISQFSFQFRMAIVWCNYHVVSSFWNVWRGEAEFHSCFVVFVCAGRGFLLPGCTTSSGGSAALRTIYRSFPMPNANVCARFFLLLHSALVKLFLLTLVQLVRGLHDLLGLDVSWCQSQRPARIREAGVLQLCFVCHMLGGCHDGIFPSCVEPALLSANRRVIDSSGVIEDRKSPKVIACWSEFIFWHRKLGCAPSVIIRSRSHCFLFFSVEHFAEKM
jgi:hypothetical protein